MFYIILVMLIIFSSSSSFAWDCVPGKYTGRSWAQIVGLHNMDVSLDVSKNKEKCILHFKCDETAANETWELEGNKFVQTELDAKGKEKFRYAANLEVRKGVEGYYLNCGADGKTGCDANGDSRTFWRIETPKGKIIYSMWSVEPSKISNPKEVSKKRLEYTFQAK